LALIFHLCEFPELSEVCVSVESVELAIKWAGHLEAHAKKVYSNVIYSEIVSGHALAKKIKSGAVVDGMTVRSIYRKGWSQLESGPRVDKALGLLEDLGWLRVEQVRGATKAREEIRLNPSLVG
jgi:hypothetical protein